MEAIDLESSKVVILTALREEYNAVREQLEEIDEIEENGSIYEQGIFKVDGQPVARVVIRECGQGNDKAAQEVERAIRAFSPLMIFFVGIAGSRKPGDFSVGDVIVGEKIYFYEGGKDLKGSFKARPDAKSSSNRVIEYAKSIGRGNEWKPLFKGTENISQLKGDCGIIASGAKLIEDVQSHQGAILAEHYNDTQAVEMEGYGFVNAMSRQEEAIRIYGVIRGISDILEQGISDGAEAAVVLHKAAGQDRRPADTKKLASRTAAAFTFQLVYKIVLAQKKSPLLIRQN